MVVVITTSENTNRLVKNLVDKPMLIVNALRPATSKLMFERLWFADSPERIALRFLNQANQTECFLTVLGYPPSKILKGC